MWIKIKHRPRIYKVLKIVKGLFHSNVKKSYETNVYYYGERGTEFSTETDIEKFYLTRLEKL